MHNFTSDDPKQSQWFIDMAREVEAEKSPDAMEKTLGKVVCHPELDSGTDWSVAPKTGRKVRATFPDGTQAIAFFKEGSWMVSRSNGKDLRMNYEHGRSTPIAWELI